jgi:hypothetical protein
MVDVTDIKEARMKVKRLAFVLLSIAAFSAYITGWRRKV